MIVRARRANVSHALNVGAWTNAMAFVPLAFRPQLDEHPLFLAAVTTSFATTTLGFCGITTSAMRRSNRRRSRSGA